MIYVASFVAFIFKLIATGVLLAIGFEVGRRVVIWYDSQVILRKPEYEHSYAPA